jgi:thiosulfate dehydrogenase (quinone) large subunit
MSNNSTCSSSRCDWAYAHLILRLWVGLRLLWAGLDKMREKGGNGFGLEFVSKSMEPIVDNMQRYAFLPGFSIGIYAAVLPWALLIVGAWTIVGIATRIGLLAAGLVFISLSVGLMALPDDNQVVMRGIEVALTALALMTASDNKFSLDGLLSKKKGA